MHMHLKVTKEPKPSALLQSCLCVTELDALEVHHAESIGSAQAQQAKNLKHLCDRIHVRFKHFERLKCNGMGSNIHRMSGSRFDSEKKQ
jgi:hypothetical protein